MQNLKNSTQQKVQNPFKHIIQMSSPSKYKTQLLKLSHQLQQSFNECQQMKKLYQELEYKKQKIMIELQKSKQTNEYLEKEIEYYKQLIHSPENQLKKLKDQYQSGVVINKVKNYMEKMEQIITNILENWENGHKLTNAVGANLEKNFAKVSMGLLKYMQEFVKSGVDKQTLRIETDKLRKQNTYLYEMTAQLQDNFSQSDKITKKLHSQLKKHRQQVQYLQQQNKELSIQIQQIRKMSSKKAIIISPHNDHVEESPSPNKKQYSTSNSHGRGVGESAVKMKEMVRMLEAKVGQLEEQRDMLIRQIQDRQARKQQQENGSNEEYQKPEGAYSFRTPNNDKKQNSQIILEQKNKQLQQHCTKLEQKLAEYEQKIRDMQMNGNNNQMNLVNTDSNLLELLQRKQKQIHQLQQQIQSCELEKDKIITVYENQSHQSKDKIIRHQDALMEMEKVIKTLKFRNQELNRANKGLSKDIVEKQKDIEDKCILLEQKNKEIQMLKNEFEENDAFQDVQQLRKQLVAKQRQISANDKQLTDAKLTIEDLNQNLTKKQSKLHNLQNKIHDLHTQIHQLSSQTQKQQLQIQKLNMINQLNSQQQPTVNHQADQPTASLVEELKNNNQLLEEQLQNCKQRMKQESMGLEKKMRNMEDKLQDCENRREVLEGELEAKDKIVDRLQTELREINKELNQIAGTWGIQDSLKICQSISQKQRKQSQLIMQVTLKKQKAINQSKHNQLTLTSSKQTLQKQKQTLIKHNINYINQIYQIFNIKPIQSPNSPTKINSNNNQQDGTQIDVSYCQGDVMDKWGRLLEQLEQCKAGFNGYKVKMEEIEAAWWNKQGKLESRIKMLIEQTNQYEQQIKDYKQQLLQKQKDIQSLTTDNQHLKEQLQNANQANSKIGAQQQKISKAEHDNLSELDMNQSIVDKFPSWHQSQSVSLSSPNPSQLQSLPQSITFNPIQPSSQNSSQHPPLNLSLSPREPSHLAYYQEQIQSLQQQLHQQQIQIGQSTTMHENNVREMEDIINQLRKKLASFQKQIEQEKEKFIKEREKVRVLQSRVKALVREIEHSKIETEEKDNVIGKLQTELGNAKIVLWQYQIDRQVKQAVNSIVDEVEVSQIQQIKTGTESLAFKVKQSSLLISQSSKVKGSELAAKDSSLLLSVQAQDQQQPDQSYSCINEQDLLINNSSSRLDRPTKLNTKNEQAIKAQMNEFEDIQRQQQERGQDEGIESINQLSVLQQTLEKYREQLEAERLLNQSLKLKLSELTQHMQIQNTKKSQMKAEIKNILLKGADITSNQNKIKQILQQYRVQIISIIGAVQQQFQKHQSLVMEQKIEYQEVGVQVQQTQDNEQIEQIAQPTVQMQKERQREEQVGMSGQISRQLEQNTLYLSIPTQTQITSRQDINIQTSEDKKQSENYATQTNEQFGKSPACEVPIQTEFQVQLQSNMRKKQKIEMLTVEMQTQISKLLEVQVQTQLENFKISGMEQQECENSLIEKSSNQLNEHKEDHQKIRCEQNSVSQKNIQTHHLQHTFPQTSQHQYQHQNCAKQIIKADTQIQTVIQMSKLKSLQQQIQASNDIIEELNRSVSIYEEQINTHAYQIAQYEEEINRYRSAKLELASEVQCLKGLVEAKEQKLRELERDCENYLRQLDERQKEMQNLKVKTSEIEQRYNSKNKLMQNQLQEWKTQCRTTSMMHQTLQQRSISQSLQITNLTNQISELEQQLLKGKQRQNRLLEQVQMTKQELNQLKNQQLQQKQQQLIQIQAKTKQQQRQLHDLVSETINNASSTVQDCMQTIVAGYNNKIDVMQNKIASLNDLVMTLKSKSSTTTQHHSQKLQKQAVYLLQQIKQLQQLIQNLQQQNTETRLQLLNKTSQHSILQQQVQNLTTQLCSLSFITSQKQMKESQVSRLTEEVQEYKDKFNNSIEQFEKMVAMVAELQGKVEKMKIKDGEMESKVKTKDREIQALKKALTAVEMSNGVLEKQINALKDEVKDNEQRLEEAETELKNYQQSVEQISAESKLKISSLQDQRQVSKQKIAQLQTIITQLQQKPKQKQFLKHHQFNIKIQKYTVQTTQVEIQTEQQNTQTKIDSKRQYKHEYGIKKVEVTQCKTKCKYEDKFVQTDPVHNNALEEVMNQQRKVSLMKVELEEKEMVLIAKEHEISRKINEMKKMEEEVQNEGKNKFKFDDYMLDLAENDPLKSQLNSQNMEISSNKHAESIKQHKKSIPTPTTYPQLSTHSPHPLSQRTSKQQSLETQLRITEQYRELLQSENKDLKKQLHRKDKICLKLKEMQKQTYHLNKQIEKYIAEIALKDKLLTKYDKELKTKCEDGVRLRRNLENLEEELELEKKRNKNFEELYQKYRVQKKNGLIANLQPAAI